MGFPLHSDSSNSVGVDPTREGKGRSILKGAVVYFQKLDSQEKQPPQPDAGTKVYSWRLDVTGRAFYAPGAP